jgi:hypothetical protein
MNIILQIEKEIYDLMEDIAATPDQGSAYENMYWAARGMCRVLCQFTQDKDECDMFDRIQQEVLQQLANDTANKEDDEREEVAAAVNSAAATFEDMFSTLRKGEAAVVPEVAFEPANIPDVAAAPANDEVFF